MKRLLKEIIKIELLIIGCIIFGIFAIGLAGSIITGIIYLIFFKD